MLQSVGREAEQSIFFKGVGDITFTVLSDYQARSLMYDLNETSGRVEMLRKRCNSGTKYNGKTWRRIHSVLTKIR
jgi:hypothetical protein